ncbi:F-box protein At3g07870 [Daucus carota subsp. sativus]|uniref:F-box protein At3g07870 n=1 Tax=Daucus carota subsp. sativus TaxID=79200 RepID=UPI0007B2F346|nr:PREDICTED: F-box protein At3g07870-like [Daucus carota subsp. sativus]
MNPSTDEKSISKPNEHNVSRKGIENLPVEVSHDILARLPLSSLVQCRYVSRILRQLSHEVSLLNTHLLRIGKKNPSLIFHCLDSERNQLRFLELSSPVCNTEISCEINIPFRPSMPNKIHILGSCNGLLCISDEFRNDPYHIYNPVTRKYKELLISRQFFQQRVETGFGLDPIANEYKLVKMVYYKDPYTGPLPQQVYRCGFPNYPHSEVLVCDISNDTWRSIGSIPYEFKRQTTEHHGSPKEMLYLNGRLHWVKGSGRHQGFNSSNPRIISFDLSDEQFYEVLKPACGSLDKPNYLLSVLGGCLSAAVYTTDGNVAVWIMKEYGVKESWIKEFEIEAQPRNIDVGLQRSSNVRIFYVHGIWAYRVLHGKSVRVLCFLESGDVLLEYKDGKLASYDPGSGETTDLQFQGLPRKFNTIVHIGSLDWIKEPQATSSCIEDLET